LFPQVIKCGTTSGKDVDKFELTKLTPINSKKLQTPKIKECIGWLECKLVNSVECGDHTLFVGEVIHAEVEQSFFKNKYWNISQTKLIHHLGGNFFISSSDKQINGL
jgi:flavin reductase (DIM6/NTAB) family NADH-FMN oxidoreductase RutF